METYGLERIKWSDFWGRMTWRPEADWNGTIWRPGPSHLLPLLLLFLSSGKEKLLRYPETLHQPWGGADSDGCKRYQRTETRASPLHVCTVYIFKFMLIILVRVLDNFRMRKKMIESTVMASTFAVDNIKHLAHNVTQNAEHDWVNRLWSLCSSI